MLVFHHADCCSETVALPKRSALYPCCVAPCVRSCRSAHLQNAACSLLLSAACFPADKQSRTCTYAAAPSACALVRQLLHPLHVLCSLQLRGIVLRDHSLRAVAAYFAIAGFMQIQQRNHSRCKYIAAVLTSAWPLAVLGLPLLLDPCCSSACACSPCLLMTCSASAALLAASCLDSCCPCCSS